MHIENVFKETLMRDPAGMESVDKAQVIARNLWAVLDVERFLKTGTLFGYRCLRQTKARSDFSWCVTDAQVHSNRFFTKKAVKTGIKLLMKQNNLELPDIPGLKYREWLDTQTDRVRDLCKRARRSSAMADDAETQPYDLMAWDEEIAFATALEVFSGILKGTERFL